MEKQPQASEVGCDSENVWVMQELFGRTWIDWLITSKFGGWLVCLSGLVHAKFVGPSHDFRWFTHASLSPVILAPYHIISIDVVKGLLWTCYLPSHVLFVCHGDRQCLRLSQFFLCHVNPESPKWLKVFVACHFYESLLCQSIHKVSSWDHATKSYTLGQ